jgi:hypothetical protein
VQKLLPVAGVIVIHDTEDDQYGYSRLMAEIDVIDEDTTHRTHTRVIRRKKTTDVMLRPAAPDK